MLFLLLLMVSPPLLKAQYEYLPLGRVSPQWEQLSALPEGILHYAKSGDAVWAATYDGVFKSENNAGHWYQITSLPAQKTYSITVSGNLILAVQSWNYFGDFGTSGKVWVCYRSLDGGASFANPDTLLISSIYTSGNWAEFKGLLAVNDSTFYLRWWQYDGSVNDFIPVTKKSTDYGATWETVTYPKLNFLCTDGQAMYGASNDTLYISSEPGFSNLVKRPLPSSNVYNLVYANDRLYLDGTPDLWQSVNGGITWQSQPFNLSGELAVHGNDVYFRQSYGDLLLRANDPSLTVWDTVFQPDYHNHNTMNAYGAFGNQVFVSAYGGINYRSDDGGESWGIKSEGLHGTMFYDIISMDSNLYAIGKDYAVFKSTDGIEWDIWDRPALQAAYDEINAIPSGSLRLIAMDTAFFVQAETDTDGYRLLRTFDNGDHWDILDPPYMVANRFTINGNRIWAHDGYFTISYSDDYGETWPPIQSPVFDNFLPTGDTVLGVRVDESLNKTMLFTSYNSGESWDTLQLTGAHLRGLSIHADTMMLWGKSGAFISSDFGGSWQQKTPAFPYVYQNMPPYEGIEPVGAVAGINFLRHGVYFPDDFGGPGSGKSEMLATCDFGKTWKYLDVPDAHSFFEKNGYLYAQSSERLWRTPLDFVKNRLNAPFDTILVNVAACVGDSYQGIFITADTSYFTFIESDFNQGLSVHYSIIASAPSDTVFLDFDICAAGNSPLTGAYYAVEGVYSEQLTLQNQHGCDSVMSASITVHPEEMLWVDNGPLPYGMVYHGVVLTQDTQFVFYDTTEFGCLLTISENVTVSPSAVNELEKMPGLRVFPQPVSGVFFVEMDLPEAMELKMEVTDMLGRRVAIVSEHEFFQKGKQRIKIETGSWPSGIYFLIFQTRNHYFSKKIIKN